MKIAGKQKMKLPHWTQKRFDEDYKEVCDKEKGCFIQESNLTN